MKSSYKYIQMYMFSYKVQVASSQHRSAAEVYLIAPGRGLLAQLLQRVEQRFVEEWQQLRQKAHVPGQTETTDEFFGVTSGCSIACFWEGMVTEMPGLCHWGPSFWGGWSKVPFLGGWLVRCLFRGIFTGVLVFGGGYLAGSFYSRLWAKFSKVFFLGWLPF